MNELANIETIPVFFAVDDRYAPFLGVAIRSMLAVSDRHCFYRIHVLHTGLAEERKQKLLSEQTENACISFDDISHHMDSICHRLHLRDYYSAATYYRIFIGSLYPMYDRVLYFDSDLVFCGDVAALYHTDMGNNLLAAVHDDVLDAEPTFADYAERVLDVPAERYFNAGVLLIDLTRYRACGMEQRFVSLLSKRRFAVAQDQDYLNVLCKNSVHYLPAAWNVSASPDNFTAGKVPYIIHHKMNWKPWHYENVPYEERFWYYADQTAFAEEIRTCRCTYSLAEQLRDRLAAETLIATARQEIEAAEAASILTLPRMPACRPAKA